MCSVFFGRTMCNVIRKMVQLQAFNFNLSAPGGRVTAPKCPQYSLHPSTAMFRTSASSPSRIRAACTAAAGAWLAAWRLAQADVRRRRGALRRAAEGGGGTGHRAGTAAWGGRRRRFALRRGVRVRTTVPALLGSPILPSPPSH